MRGKSVRLKGEETSEKVSSLFRRLKLVKERSRRLEVKLGGVERTSKSFEGLEGRFEPTEEKERKKNESSLKTGGR